MRPIYLDYNATTPIAPSVLESMQPFFNRHFGNPSSSHLYGRAAHEAIEDARSQVANFLGCQASEIVFTGGGTESNNLALKGVFLGIPPAIGDHLVISAIEHPAICEPARFLEQLGVEISLVPCDEHGIVQPEAVENALRPNTRLVSIMHSNNEVGTIQPVRKIAEICREREILVHTDASQSAGKVPTRVDLLDVDMLTLAGHKFYGPKGIGVLYVREGVELESLLHGASHENGMRAGTENTPYIVGLGQAAKLASKAAEELSDQMSFLRDRLADQLREGVGDELVIHGEMAPRLPNTLNVSFPSVSGHELLMQASEVCASTGSACHSSGLHGSTTLAAMGVSAVQARGAVRLSVGWSTSVEEVDRAANLLLDSWENLATNVQ